MNGRYIRSVRNAPPNGRDRAAALDHARHGGESGALGRRPALKPVYAHEIRDRKWVLREPHSAPAHRALGKANQTSGRQ